MQNHDSSWLEFHLIVANLKFRLHVQFLHAVQMKTDLTEINCKGNMKEMAWQHEVAMTILIPKSGLFGSIYVENRKSESLFNKWIPRNKNWQFENIDVAIR